MKFDYSQRVQTPNPSPEYDQPYGAVLPSSQAKGNISYLQFIDVVDNLWRSGHPEIQFGPFGAHKIFNPEYGYIIYTLEDKKPRANHPKPRLYEVINDELDPSKKIAVFIENFNAIVKFTAIHKDARVCEELVEQFEDFIIEITPILKMIGLENIYYVRRMADSHETRYGDDVSTRAVAYQIGIQKILTTDLSILQGVLIQAQAVIAGDATPSYNLATPTYKVNVNLMDNNTTGT